MTFSDLAVLLIFAAAVTVCTVRGLAMSLYSTFSTVIAIVGAFLLRPLVSAGLTAAGAEGWFSDGIYRQLDAARAEHFTDAVSGTGRQLSESLGLPRFLQDFLADKTASWTVQSGFETVEREISQAISSLLVSILSLVLLILVIVIVMFLLRNILSVFSKIPVIRKIDRAGGFLLGLIMAFFWVCVIGLLLQLFSASAVFAPVVGDIERSLFAKYFYGTNVFAILLSKL